MRSDRALRATQNRRLADDLGRLLDRADQMFLLCECGNTACGSRVSILRAEYEQVPPGQARFIVAPGHAMKTDDVVLIADNFWIVEERPPE